MREQRLLSTVLTELRKQLPFALLGLDTDNDSVFMNETLKEYCEQADMVFTRYRPCRKNDQALSSRRTARWSAEWSATVDSRGSKRPLCWRSLSVRPACS